MASKKTTPNAVIGAMASGNHRTIKMRNQKAAQYKTPETSGYRPSGPRRPIGIAAVRARLLPMKTRRLMTG